MGQIGTESDDRYHIFSFLGSGRPKRAAKGERVTLNLIDEQGKEVRFSGIATWSEVTPSKGDHENYMMDLNVMVEGILYNATVFIGDDDKMDGVRMWRNLTPRI